MQYLRVVLFVAFLVFPALSLSTGVVAAQDTPDDPVAELTNCLQGGLNEGHENRGEWWTAVCRPVPLDASEQVQIFGTQLLRPYAVKFAEEHGATRPNPDAEFMVILVTQGEFALDVDTDNAVVVTAASGSLKLLQRLPDDQAPYYQETGGTLACPFACSIDSQQPVLLSAGDVAVAKQGALCLWCLLHAGEGEVGSGGVLQVMALLDPSQADDPESFSWIQDWDLYQNGLQADSTRDSSMVRGWAFNPPSSRCHGG